MTGGPTRRGFDPPDPLGIGPPPSAGDAEEVSTLAAAILADLAAVVLSDRSAVVLDDGGWAVPVALRGASGFPWGEPTRTGCVLHCSWTGQVARVERFQDPSAGVRELLSVPLVSGDEELLGLLVADRDGPAYGEEDILAATEVARRSEPRLQWAVLLARHREDAIAQERARLARQVHDGLAQQMAALGYQADAARRLVRAGDPTAPPAVEELHGAIRDAVGAARAHLAELTRSPRNLEPLGAVIAGEVEAFATLTGATVRVDVSDTGLRFVDRVEAALDDVVAAVLADARAAPDLTTVEVSGVVDAPSARLQIRHDGATGLQSGTFDSYPLARLGGEVRVDATGQRGLVVTIGLPGASRRPRSVTPGGDA